MVKEMERFLVIKMIEATLVTSIYIIGIIIAFIVAHKRGGILPLFICTGSGIVSLIIFFLLV